MKIRSLREQTLAALAFAGDLSMGQPPEHSPAVACLAARIAQLSGASPQTVSDAAQLALIRWAGCTANAQGFSDLLGDDIRGRAELIAGRNPFVAADPPAGSIHSAVQPLALAHCEVAAHLSIRLGLSEAVSAASSDFFETWDGTGLPLGKAGEHIAELAQFVTLAGDAEVFSRIYGVTRASVLIDCRANKNYEAGLALRVAKELPNWLQDLQGQSLVETALELAQLDVGTDLEDFEAAAILGDFADLKVPGHVGQSRSAETLAQAAARAAGISTDQVREIVTASVIAALGRVAISNSNFEFTTELTEAARLAPHWTDRILSRIPRFANARVLARQAYERLDGSGLGQGLTAPALSRAARLVQTVRAAVEIPRHLSGAVPSVSVVQDHLTREVNNGRLDGASVAVVLSVMGAQRSPGFATDNQFELTPREGDVLVQLARGQSNKQIARSLEISPKTVSIHLERVFRKLEVNSRAAAALKAMEYGFIYGPH